MAIKGFTHRKECSVIYYLIFSLCMVMFPQQIYAQTAERSADNQALPLLNCDDFKQSIRRVYTMLDEKQSYETIYQTIAPKDSTVRAQILGFVLIAHTATFYNKGSDVEAIVSTIDKNCGADNKYVVDKDLNTQCDMYVFLINAMDQARAKGAKSIDDLPITWKQPTDSLDQKSADLAQFAMKFRQNFVRPFLQELLDNPQQTGQQSIDKFNKACRYTIN